MEVARHNLIAYLDTDDEMTRDAIPKQTTVLAPVLDALDHKLEMIDRDRGLSPEGKQERTTAARREAAEKLESAIDREYRRWMDSARTDMEKTKAALDGRLDFGHKPDAVSELRARELRDRLLAMPDTDRFALAMRAADTNDVETLRAIVHAPQSFPILSPAELEKMHEVHVERHYPAEVQKIAKFGAMLTSMDYNERTARTAIAGNGLDPAADPLNEIQNRHAEAH